MAEHGKQKSPRMFAYPSGAYASAEQSAVRDMYVYRSEQASAYVDINSFNIYDKRFCYLVEKISFENGGESSGNYRNPELKQRRSGVSTVHPAFRLDAVQCLLSFLIVALMYLCVHAVEIFLIELRSVERENIKTILIVSTT